MPFEVTKKIKRRARGMSLAGTFVALAVGVILPVLLSTAVGIVALALGESSTTLIVGVLVVSFAAAAIGGAVTAIVLLGRRARVVRLQADLLTNMTHDLRTPLAAIRMYAQTLQAGRLKEDPERTRASLETILRETEWLEAMIDKVLTWRSTVKDRQILEMKTQPIREAMELASGRFTKMVVPGEVDFSEDLKSTAPVAHDRYAIVTVVLNLLVNAYKYTGADKKISLRTHDRDGWVVITVEDNGIGIPRKEMGRVFDPFYRVDTRLVQKASGAGLGLAIVRHLVRAHSGEIDVESVEEKGSRFSVRLPAARIEGHPS